METTDILAFTEQALMLVLALSLPPIIAAAGVGTLVALVQALTQLQEQTLTFAFKLITVSITIFITAAWVGSELFQFGLATFDLLPTFGRPQ